MSEGLALADEVAGLAGGVEVPVVPVGAEFLVGPPNEVVKPPL
jgi:hypothetical protein